MCYSLGMDSLYVEDILEHYKHPQNFGELDPHDAEFFGYNPFCGDQLGVHIRLSDDAISDLRFHGSGCAISMASASIISSALIGMPVAEIEGLGEPWLEEQIGISLSPARLKCGQLALKVVQTALFGKQDVPAVS